MEAIAHNLVSVEDYLAGEEVSDIKHEFVGGVVYAMAGAKVAHNRVASSILIALGQRLRGKPCEAFNSDMKVRIRMASETRFYYPDVMVVCRSNRPDESFQDEPVIIIEVISESTRRVDEGEKKEAYLTIPSLHSYVLFETDNAAAVIYQRLDRGFDRRVYTGQFAVVPLPVIEAELSLAEIYGSPGG